MLCCKGASVVWLVIMTGVPDGTLFLGSSREQAPINSEQASINAAKDFFLMVTSNFQFNMSDIITLFTFLIGKTPRGQVRRSDLIKF